MSTSASMKTERLLVEQSGLASSHEPVDATLVSLLLERHFHIGGQLERVATEKDDTFILKAHSRSYLVKVSPPPSQRSRSRCRPPSCAFSRTLLRTFPYNG